MFPSRLFLCFMCLQLHHNVFAAKILGLFSAPLYSHQLIYQSLMKALADRGHEVFVVSPNPLKELHKNYVDIDQSFLYAACQAAGLEKMHMNIPSEIEFINIVRDINVFVGNAAAEAQLKSSDLQQFLEFHNSTFDLVIVERLATLFLDGIVHHFGSPPKVGILSFLVPSWMQDSVGNPHNPSYAPNMFVSYSDHKTFWERLMSVYIDFMLLYNWHYEVIPHQDAIMRNHFVSDPPPPISESDRNFSFVLYHGDWSVAYPFSLLPSVVALRGIHIQKTPKPLEQMVERGHTHTTSSGMALMLISLPQHIQKFMDGAVEGVVYFSLGSNINSRNLPDSAAQMILDALAQLPQRVLLKWHSTELDEKIENIMVAEWFPQQDVLAHQNVKVFITQCGIQSMQEAIYHAVPIVAIPFLQEQKLNSRKIVDDGAGLSIDISEITQEILVDAISTLVKEKSYKENMERLSTIIKDEPQPSLERGVWWLEYIIRNNGAKHLQPAVMDLLWPQYLLIDVFLTTLAVLFFSVLLVRLIIGAVRKRLTQ